MKKSNSMAFMGSLAKPYAVGILTALVLGVAFSHCAHAARYFIPLFLSASHPHRQGFVRIINHSDATASVRIEATDDSGHAPRAIALSIRAGESVHFNSDDLEDGNPGKGLPRGIGGGEGDWRLEVSTSLSIEPLAYVRTADGFLTSMHDTVESAHMQHHVPFFNPGSNHSQQSRLRLINPESREVEVTISGVDDRGELAHGGEVHVTLSPRGARMITAQQLENGSATLRGSLGDGEGKWRLFIEAEHAIYVMSLLQSVTGNLTNLSTSTVDPEVAISGPTTPTDDLAPADRAGFERWLGRRRFVATDYLTPTVDARYLFNNGRFTSTWFGLEYTGRYTYENTGPQTGRYALTFESGGGQVHGDVCRGSLFFTSSSHGTYLATCSGSGLIRGGSGSWRVE